MAKDNLSKKTNYMVCDDFDLNKNFTEDFEKYCDSDESLGILSLNLSDSSEDDLLFDKIESVGVSNQLHHDSALTEECNIPSSKYCSVQNFFTKLHPIKEDEQTLKSTDSFSEQVDEKVINLSEEQRYLSTTITLQNTCELNKSKNENHLVTFSPTCNISKFQYVNSEIPFQSMYCSTPKHNSSYTFNVDEFPNYGKESLLVSPLSKTICNTETMFAQSSKLEDCGNIISNRTAILTSDTCEGDSNKNILSVTHNIEIPLNINDSKLNKTFDVITHTDNLQLESKNKTFNLKKMDETHEIKLLVSDSESMCENNKTIKNNSPNVKYLPGNCKEWVTSETKASASSQGVTNVTCNVLNETVTMVTENENFNLDKKHVPHDAEILKYDKNIKNSSLNSETPISTISQDVTNVTCNILNETVTMVTENENFNLDKKHMPREAEISKYDKNIKNSFLNVKYHPETCKEWMNSETPISASSQDVTNVTCNVLNETVTLVAENDNFNLDKKNVPHEAKSMKYDKNIKSNFSNMKYLPKNCKEWMNSEIPISASSQDWTKFTCNVLNETVTMVTENKNLNLDEKYVSHETEIQNITNEIDVLGELPKIGKPSKFQKQIETMKMSKIARISNISSPASNNKSSEFDKKKTRKSINVINKNLPTNQNQNRNRSFGSSAMNDNIAENQSPVVQKYLSCTTADSKTVTNTSRIPKNSLLKEEINIKPVRKTNLPSSGIYRRNVTNDSSPLVGEISSRFGFPKLSLEKKQDFSLHKTTNLMNTANCAAKILKENVSSLKQDFLPKKSNGLQNPSTGQLRYSKRSSISDTGTKEKTFVASGVQGKRLSFQSGLNSGPSSLSVKNLEGKSSVPEKSTMKKTESKKISKIRNPYGNLR